MTDEQLSAWAADELKLSCDELDYIDEFALWCHMCGHSIPYHGAEPWEATVERERRRNALIFIDLEGTDLETVQWKDHEDWDE